MNIQNNKFNLRGKDILKNFKDIYGEIKFKSNELSILSIRKIKNNKEFKWLEIKG